MKKNPNIVLITTDQHRADIRKSEGFEYDVMPFLDSLAKKGVDFKKSYTSMPLCAPARTSLTTGRYPTAAHVKVNPNLMDNYCSEDIYDVLHRNDYKIGLVGKDHTFREKDHDIFNLYYGIKELENDENNTEKQKAFDTYRKNLKHLADHKPTKFDVEDIEPYRLTSKAIEFIKNNQKDSFFLQLGMREPHNPFYAPEPYFSMFDPTPNETGKEDLVKKGDKYIWQRKIWEENITDFNKEIKRTKKNYCGMLKIIDEQIERVYNYLKENELLENTIIIYVSDHGDFFGEYGLIRKGPGLPEVLCRIPLIIVGPEIKAKEKKCMEHVSICDIMPTISEIIGEDISDGVQGKSILPILMDMDYPKCQYESVYIEQGAGGLYFKNEDIDNLTPENKGIAEAVTIDELNSVTQAGKMRAVIKNDWKLTFDMMGKGEMYNLIEDKYELNNLYDNKDCGIKKVELLEELLKSSIRASDDLPYSGTERHIIKRDKKRNYYQ
ncbi:sulfatase [Vallitalea longa]|uniref:Sulfatase n=1 Tax=Vallitalea longa TaxID=2936439 RepID=A0A9W5YCH9_9FIRM|nr:sulfatase-like hydrolase/transferase [Vallitalea longa]GKX31462.1 sulfatase [Vallitalea longa]